MAVCLLKMEQKRSKSLTEIAAIINEELPTHLTSSDCNEYPELVKLLQSLSSHLTSSGKSYDVHRDVIQAEELLHQKKTIWLQYKLLYSEVQDMITEFDISCIDMNPSSDSEKFYKTLSDLMTRCEIEDTLDCFADPDTTSSLLGLTRAGLEYRNPHKKHKPAIQQKLIPDMETRLKKKCETLLGFYESCSDTNSKLTHAKIAQLPNLLHLDIESLEEESKSLRKDKQNQETLFWNYYKVLVEFMDLLEELITSYGLHHQSHSDKITSELLAAQCDEMSVNIKVMELEILCDTYTVETVEALKIIRKHIDVSMEDTQIELHWSSQAVAAYEAVGMGFDQLVDQFGMLTEEIANKKWTLNEFHQNLTS